MSTYKKKIMQNENETHITEMMLWPIFVLYLEKCSHIKNYLKRMSNIMANLLFTNLVLLKIYLNQ